ncbi:MAG: glycoside hydrolase family 43 protein [Saprospiraceae bacterium]|nr:glycoside hydrolase family 43 protein [Saprospiraceae bacterium]
MQKILPTLLGFSLLLSCSQSADKIFVFSYFMNNGEDGLHLAYSEDGFNWSSLNNNESFLTPTAGKDKLMRDPCIIKGGDGKFHMVWTVSWNEQGIGYAHSLDLINWSEQQYIPVMEHEPKARNCWAPELYYDEKDERYLIYWATTIPGRFPETDSTGDNGYNHRMYYTTTKDFTTFSETQLLYDHGFNVIDATIHKTQDEYIMFLKNEIRYPKPEKNLRIAKSQHLLGPYSMASDPVSPKDVWVEGPTAIPSDQGWTVYFDRYMEKRMGAIFSEDLKEWTDITEEVDFPDGTRHGTVFKASRKVLEGLLAK